MIKDIDGFKEWISLVNNWLLLPKTEQEINDWLDDAYELSESFEFCEPDMHFVENMISSYEQMFDNILHDDLKESIQQFEDSTAGLSSKVNIDISRIELCTAEEYVDIYMEAETIVEQIEETPDQVVQPPAGLTTEEMDRLINCEQIEQRTPAWYAQTQNVLTASEISTIFSTPYARGQLVISKAFPSVDSRPSQPTAVQSDRMSPFDWGIRFEPVIKQIYEYKYSAEVKELGRIVHPDSSTRCAASPDGLVYSSKEDMKTGRLIEIKCPVTRVINDKIPNDYYCQMQLQMEVTGAPVCDYIEAKIVSTYSKPIDQVQYYGPYQYHGKIYLVESATEFGIKYEYRYSPLNEFSNDWHPTISENENVLEIIPWYLYSWNEVEVKRDTSWFETLRILLTGFWSDVDKARSGEYVKPESTRKRQKTTKEDKCLIQITHVESIDNNNDIDMQ
jgi:putative phage-type endonuclease